MVRTLVLLDVIVCQTCDDGILIGDEMSIDCGGQLCEPCQGCTYLEAHNYDKNVIIDDGSCMTCLGGIQNGTETGIDCGGTCEVQCCYDTVSLSGGLNVIRDTIIRASQQVTINGIIISEGIKITIIAPEILCNGMFESNFYGQAEFIMENGCE